MLTFFFFSFFLLQLKYIEEGIEKKSFDIQCEDIRHIECAIRGWRMQTKEKQNKGIFYVTKTWMHLYVCDMSAMQKLHSNHWTFFHQNILHYNRWLIVESGFLLLLRSTHIQTFNIYSKEDNNTERENKTAARSTIRS